MDRRIQIQLNGGRKVTGVLRGFDAFLNLVLDETMEEALTASDKDQAPSARKIGMVVIRGNSVVMMEALEKIA